MYVSGKLIYLLAAHDEGAGLKGGSLHCGLLSVTELIARESDKQGGFANPACISQKRYLGLFHLDSDR